MNRIIRYTYSLPKQFSNYGITVTLTKIFIDICLELNIPLSNKFRWKAAHRFHTQWKIHQKNFYGLEEYNRRIDEKSLEVLNDFYETGVDFTGKTVLDVGCGTRGILPIIKADRRIGVDPAISSLDKHFGFEQGIEYYSDKAEELSLPDNSVDIVTCNNALNHFQVPMMALAQIYRVLKPKGILLLEVFIEPENIGHTYSFTVKELEGMCKDFFESVKVKYEPLKVNVVIDENLNGKLPYRWGGVFQK